MSLSIQTFAQIKTTRTKSTDILIKYFRHNVLMPHWFLSSELPFRTIEKTLFFNLNIIPNFGTTSDKPDELRTEKYTKYTYFGLTGLFVVNNFGMGLSVQITPAKATSKRTLLWDDSTNLNYYELKDTATLFNLKAWVGYKIRNNLGIGLDLYYETIYKYFVRDYTNLTTSFQEKKEWNIAEEKLTIGPSVTYKPLPVLRFSYNLSIIFKRRIEAFYFDKEDLINISNYLKVVVIPVKDVFFIYLDFLYLHEIGKNYDNIWQDDLTWIYEEVLGINLTIDVFIVKDKFYIRGGGFYKHVFRRTPENLLRSLIRPHYELWENMFGFQVGVGYKLDTTFSFALDFIYKYHKYQTLKDYTEEWFKPYAIYEIIFQMRVKL